MQTRHIIVDPVNPEEEALQEAAAVIENHGLVAFPTETVYGLGANAYVDSAVAKIFAAKNRPATTPLLVHVSDAGQVAELVTGIPEVARLLMQKFWPGPLSIILPASGRVPAVVTGGKSSVGLRMPSHPVALALIARTGPLAAPSANLSGRPSPVTAADVKADLEGRIECVLDAGPTGSGIESTVLDLSVHPFKVLRRGGTALEDIEAVLGERLDTYAAGHREALHGQVATRIIIARDEKDFKQQLDKWSGAGPVGVVYYNSDSAQGTDRNRKNYELDLTGRHGSLYTILRDAETIKLKTLLFSPFPLERDGITAAVIDRIYEAAGEHRPTG
ncbi:MAG TPA: threonylcarbamoyl-AMP synthase [Syntrophomonas sp.]|jgi:L-threonylcarbamoyladenylate synthase|nr:threonylcarbamoyl-AMP synthase [Syntrophomonas sp.]